jgi:hypothetical protein
MVHEISPARPRHHQQRGVLNGRDADPNDVGSGLRCDLGSEIGALRAENAELRKVVIELSKLVIRNVLRNDTRV